MVEKDILMDDYDKDAEGDVDQLDEEEEEEEEEVDSDDSDDVPLIQKMKLVIYFYLTTLLSIIYRNTQGTIKRTNGPNHRGTRATVSVVIRKLPRQVGTVSQVGSSGGRGRGRGRPAGSGTRGHGTRGRGGAPLANIPGRRATRVTHAFNNSLAAAISQSAPLGGPARTAVLFSSDSEESDKDNMEERNMNMDVDNSLDTPVNNVS